MNRHPLVTPWLAAAAPVVLVAGLILVDGARSGSRAGGAEPGAAALPPDLDAVPRDAVALASVRVADLWQHEAAKGLREKLAKEAPAVVQGWQAAVGAPPQDVERLTAVFPDVTAVQHESAPLVYVATAKPYDREKVLAAAAPGAKEEKRKGQALFAGSNGRGISFLGERAYLVGGADDIRILYERGPLKKEGPQAGALRLAAGKHSAVVGVAPQPLVKEVQDKLPPQAEPFKPLLETQAATLVLDLGREVRGEVSLHFPSEKDAQAAEPAAKQGLDLARAGLEQGIKETAEGGPKLTEVLKQVEAALKDAAVTRQGDRLEAGVTVKVDVSTAGEALVETVQKVRRAATRIQTANSLKQIALAMHNYADTNNHLPPQAVYDKDGKPLLSWRVLILPYVEQDALYRAFHLDEPWDSEHNKKLLAQMPPLYALPNSPKGTTDTVLQGFYGKGAFFEGKKGRTFAEITDGLSNTLMIVEAAKGVPWSKPEDLPFDPDKPLPRLGGHFGKTFMAAFGDGSVRTLPTTIKPDVLKALITVNGGEVLPADYDK
jgi:hypothetical protein